MTRVIRSRYGCQYIGPIGSGWNLLNYRNYVEVVLCCFHVQESYHVHESFCGRYGLGSSARSRVSWSVFSRRTDGRSAAAACRPTAIFASRRAASHTRLRSKPRREGRRPLLEAFLADAVLRAQAVARRHQPPIRALAVVAAPALSEGMTAALRDYVGAVAPGMAFGLVDGRGELSSTVRV